MRGLACVLMFQTHCYDSWLGGAARQTSFIGWSQLGGTLPAPLFLFLAGISCALVTDRMRQKGIAPNAIARTTIRRGAEILGLGLLFRVQEFVLGQPWSPWTDLLRVDVLNVIGISLMLMGAANWMARNRAANSILAGALALGISLATPPLWTTWRPHWLPWYLESYINGVHTFNVPQPWLFPIFPWAAFAFAGLASGFLLFSEWPAKNPGRAAAIFGAAGVGIFYLSSWFDALPVHLYAVYDYWHTSPNFFLARAGILLVITCAVYAWCRWGPGQLGFSPADSAGAGLPACLLGAHRIRVRAILDLAQARANDSDRDARPARDFLGDGSAGDSADTMERARRGNPGEIPAGSANGGKRLGIVRRVSGLRRGLRSVCGPRRSLENILSRPGQPQLLARNVLDRLRIVLQRFHAVLQLAILVVDEIDFLLNGRGFLLRAAHGQHSMRAKDILKQQQAEGRGQKPGRIPSEKLTQLFGKAHRWFCHFTIHARASSASFFDSAGVVDSV